MTEFLKAITERVLILDGAMGTLLQERGLSPGGCPEEMNRNAADAVIGIRYDATEVMSGVTEVICYGTAVTVEPLAE